MNTKTSIALLLILTNTLYGQVYNFKRYRAIKLSYEIDSSLCKTVRQFDHQLKRVGYLDEHALKRTNYFLSVLQFKIQEGVSVEELLDHIEQSKIAHQEQFGNPNYFKIPDTLTYVNAMTILSDGKTKINGEIMQEYAWHSNFDSRIKDLKQLAVKELDKTYKAGSITSNKIIKNYFDSPSHYKIIAKYGNGEYGNSTRILIAENQLEDGKWRYQFILYNLIVFSKPLKS